MDRFETSTPLDLQAAGRLIGSYRWMEKQLFGLLGSWVDSAPETAVKLFLDQQSFEYAWHAELWADRLPDRRGVDIAGLTAPANSGVAGAVQRLVDRSAGFGSIERLTAIYRVFIPRMVTAYSSHLEHAPMAGSDPTQRTLRLILADEISAWRAGECHLQALLVDVNAVDRAAAEQRRIEAKIVEAGGVALLTT